MKGVQCYELFGGIALKKSHIFIFHFHYCLLLLTFTKTSTKYDVNPLCCIKKRFLKIKVVVVVIAIIQSINFISRSTCEQNK